MVLTFWIVVVLVVVFYMTSGAYLRNERPGVSVLFFFAGGLFLALVIIGAPNVFPSGGPKLHIGPGDYKVAFVHVAGDKVSVGIEFEWDNKSEHLYMYQFDQKAFDGDINIKAKKLVVVVSRGFKKLQLE